MASSSVDVSSGWEEDDGPEEEEGDEGADDREEDDSLSLSSSEWPAPVCPGCRFRSSRSTP